MDVSDLVWIEMAHFALVLVYVTLVRCFLLERVTDGPKCSLRGQTASACKDVSKQMAPNTPRAATNPRLQSGA